LPRPTTWSGSQLQKPDVREFTYFQEGVHAGLYDFRDERNVWKYWVNPRSGEECAFNLSLDPREMTNVVGSVLPAQKREWRLRSLPGSSIFFEKSGVPFG